MTEAAPEIPTQWLLQSPAADGPPRPSVPYIASCIYALDSAQAHLGQATLLLQFSPENGVAIDRALHLAGNSWAAACASFEAYRQIRNCEGQG